MAFIFDPEKGETPETIKRKRDLVRALMQASRPASNVGEGLSVIGDGIVSAVLNSRANRAEKAGLASADADFGPIEGFLTGFPEAPALPSSGGQANPVDLSGNEIFSGFMDTVKTGVSNPYALAAIGATGKHESAFSPENIARTWNDPSESGAPGRAGGVMSWRGPRYEALANFAGENIGSPEAQAKFFLQENPQLIEALNNAGSVDEAMSLMNNAWKFAGYNRAGGEAARRLQTARSLLPTFQQSVSDPRLASIEPQVAIDTMTSPQAQVVAAASRGRQAPDLSGIDPQTMATPGPDEAYFGQAAVIPRSGDTPEAMPQAQPASQNPAARRILQTLLNAQPLAEQAAPMQLGAPEPEPAEQVAQAAPEQVIPPMAGGPAPQVDNRGPTIQALMKAAANPFLSEGRRAIVNSLLQRELQKQDPAYQLEVERARIGAEKDKLELELLRKPRMSPYEREQIELRKRELDAQDNKLLELSPNTTVFDPQNRQPVYTAPGDGSAPTVQTFYDDMGREYKAEWRDGDWRQVGGAKPPSGGVTVTSPDGTTMTLGGSGGGKITEQQGKDIVYYTQGTDANTRLADLESELTDFAQANTGLIPLGIGNYLRTPEYRQASVAAERFLSAVLRKETGAAVTDTEWNRYGPMFLPIPGDDDGTIQQKRRAREVALLAIRSGLGTAEAIIEANRIILGLPEKELPLTPHPETGGKEIDGYTIEQVPD